jgi:hypothetical protein
MAFTLIRVRGCGKAAARGVEGRFGFMPSPEPLADSREAGDPETGAPLPKMQKTRGCGSPCMNSMPKKLQIPEELERPANRRASWCGR